MEFIKRMKAQSSAFRLSEELLYEKVTQELAAGVQRDGLMAKAMADADGDPDKTRALYIKYRVRSMRDEAELASVIKEKEAEARASRARVDTMAENIKSENDRKAKVNVEAEKLSPEAEKLRNRVERRAAAQHQESVKREPYYEKSASMKLWGVIKVVCVVAVILTVLNFMSKG